MDKPLVSNGNMKIGQDTLIMNLNSAHDCPAKQQCLVANSCYAYRSEQRFPVVLKYRRRQEEAWNNHNAKYFIEMFKKLKTGGLKYIRFQESGDFASQRDLDKLSEISEGLKGIYRCYTYSSRTDLDYGNKSDNLVVTGSHFMVDNMYCSLRKQAYDMLLEMSPGAVRCPNDCRLCTLCKEARGIVIYQKMH